MNLVAFDLDGVLINSKGAYVSGFCEAIEKLTGKCSRDEIAYPLGKPVIEVLRELLPDSHSRIAEGSVIVRDFVSRDDVIDAIPVCGSATDALNAIKSSGEYFISLVTNSDRVFTEKILKRHQLLDFFNAVLTAEEKPVAKEERIKSLLNLSNTRAESSFYVGDLPADVYAAKKVDLRTVISYNEFSWVYPNRDVVLKSNPDFLISDLRELSRILKLD